MPRVALIVNPFASAVDEHRIKLVEGALARTADVATHLTERRGHATEIAQLVSDDVDAIFVYSGDGGFNEVVNGLGPDAPPRGCIPGGGTSVFPRGLGSSRDPVTATEQRVGAFVQDVDRLEVRCDRPLPLQADGEDLGDVTEAVFEAEREVLSVLV